MSVWHTEIMLEYWPQSESSGLECVLCSLQNDGCNSSECSQFTQSQYSSDQGLQDTVAGRHWGPAAASAW